MTQKISLFILFLFALPLFSGCQKEDQRETPAPASTVSEKDPEPSAPTPPAPPVHETFDGAPQLSLFARLGDYRPEEQDERTLPYWRTYQEHLVKTAGVVVTDESGNRAYSFRSIKGIDSVGFFSPIAVKPDTRYQVSFRAKGELPEGASAGIGVLEFNRFLWVGEQFPRSLDEEHRTGQVDGVTFGGTQDWQQHSFTFTTRPETGMIHLVLHREGTPSREPVLFDDIRVEPTSP